MGEPIKGHMTRVDRLRARLLCGQFVHSVQNNSIQVFDNTLTEMTEKLLGKLSYNSDVCVCPNNFQFSF